MINMIHWLKKNRETTATDRIEEVFFKAIIVIALFTTIISVVFDLIITTNFTYIVPANILFIQILLLTLYAIRKFRFKCVAIVSLTLLDVAIIARGISYPEFDHVSRAFLICVGFMAALISQGLWGKFLRWIILVCFVGFVFRAFGQLPIAQLIRQALPYLMVYAVIAILTGLLKEQYAKGHARLITLIDLLNEKNFIISNQHTKLQSSYQELSDLNQGLADIIQQKNNSIGEKNRQLAQIAYENSHFIRAPLARMLGLLHLMKLDPSRKDFYIAKLDDQAIDMDNRICMLIRSIEKNLRD